MSAGLTRRAALAGAGALVLSFSLSRARGLAETAKSSVLPKPSLPGSLAGAPRLDALDSRRCAGRRHHPDRQGGARARREDRAAADRRRGAQGRIFWA